jgi:autoinducer 2-degrading protein
MYTVISFHRILPQHLDDYIENMRICAAKSNEEPGCIRYEVMQDVYDPTMFCLTQVFRDDDAYQAHQDAEHHTHWMAISGGWRDLNFRERHQLQYVTPEPARPSGSSVAG